MKTSGIKTYFLITLITIAFCGASCLVVGLSGIFAWIVIAALLGFVIYRYHFLLGIVNSGLVIAIFSLFGGIFTGLTNAVPLILLGITLALGTRFKLPLYRLLTIASVLYLLNMLFGLELMGISSSGEVTLNSLWLNAGQQLREMTAEFYPESVEVFEKAISMTVQLMLMISPALMILFSVVMAYVLIIVYKKIQTIQGLDMSFITPFSRLQAEKGFSVFYLILVLLFFSVPEGIFHDAILNVLITTSVLFFVIGLSVLCFKLKQEESRSSARRILIVLLITASTAFFIVPFLGLVFCGILDGFFDYRKLRPQEE